MNSLFDLPQVAVEKPIRLITLFSGIGSQEMALRDIGADFERWRAVEFDKFAVAGYNAIHGTNFPVLDICNVTGKDLEIVDTDKYDYIFVYSFPCQALSLAGQRKGMKEGSGTSSSLLWEVKRLLVECSDLSKSDPKYGMPKILLMENVPQVHSEQNIHDFEIWLNFLREKGYFNHYEDLNGADFGIPQHRERCFCVSVLSEEFIDFKFPKTIPLKYVMKDFLETEVDEKYYINKEKSDKLVKQLEDEGKLPLARERECGRMNNNRVDEMGTKEAKTLMARDYKGFGTGFDTQNGVVEG